MIFEGKIVKGKTSKGPSNINTYAFDKAVNFSAATHIKFRDINRFERISKQLVIKQKKDSDGKPMDKAVNYTQIKSIGKQQFVCVLEGKEYPIEPELYTQIVLMNKSEKGNYYRCDDGVYVHIDEIQVPAYKKVATYDNVQLSGPVHNGEYYVETEVVQWKENSQVKEATLTSHDRLRQVGDTWQYQKDDGNWVDCYYTKDVDTRKYIRHILLDNDKIVDVSKLKHKPNGNYVIEDVDGEDIVVGKQDVTISRGAIIEGSTVESINDIVIPHNILKQRPRIEEGVNLAFVWNSPSANGLVRIDVNRSRTWARFTYANGRQEVYAQYDVSLNLAPNVKEFRIQKLNIEDLGEQGVKIEFLQKKNDIARNLKFEDGKVSSYTLNDRNITNIKWQEVGGYNEIEEYTIDGTRVFDIEWHAGAVKSCKLQLKDADGNDVVEEIKDLKTSKYRHFAITYQITEKIEDIKTDGSTFSFKMGDYKFSEAQLGEDNKVGKCKLKHDGKEEEIDLSKDERFSHLKIAVDIALDQSRVVPLVQSQLLTKKDGQYKLEADVVQAGPMLTNEELMHIGKDEASKLGIKGAGVASAKSVETVQQAVKEQEQFKENPFKTVVLDDKNKNKVHTLTDVNTRYESSSSFDHGNNMLVDKIGKTKIEIKKGKLVIDPKKANDLRDNTIVLGFMLCSNPITLIFGIGTLFVGTGIGIIAPIARAIKTARLNNASLEKLTTKMQKKAEKAVEKNINQLTSSYKKTLKAYKKMYSQEEYKIKAKELRSKFIFEYQTEIGRLQIMGNGGLECEFDSSKKTKLTKDNYLGYLQYRKDAKTLRDGKQSSPKLESKLAKVKTIEAEDERVVAEIEVYKQYGGIKHQKMAYAMQKKYINILLDAENKARKERDEKGISLEDFRKQLDQEYRETIAQYGGIDDKLEAYKHTEEYLLASNKDRKKLLTKKKEELEGELTKIKVTRVEFNERLDKNGNPIVEQRTRIAMAHMERILPMFGSGDIKLKKQHFSFKNKLTKMEQELYDSPISLNEVTAQKVNSLEQRRLEYDKTRNAEAITTVSAHQATVKQGVDKIQTERKNAMRTRDYESSFKLALEIESKASQFELDCKKVETDAKKAPNVELNVDATNKVLEDMTATRVNYAKQKKIAERSKQAFEKDYQIQVKDWALKEFAETHKSQFAWYSKFFTRVSNGVGNDPALMYASFYQEMSKDKEKSESYAKELDAYKVKHHIEENISAEVFCEIHREDFEKFIAERNAKSTKGELDIDSEIARCYYYSHCKQQNPLRIEKFNTYFAKRCRARAVEKFEQGTLAQHEEKVIKKKIYTKPVEKEEHKTSSRKETESSFGLSA